MPYPTLLASGVTTEGTFLPFELFAGESDIVTSQGLAAANIAQFQPIARDADGHLVPWTNTAGAATVSGTFSGVGTAGDTITINGTVFTLRATATVPTDILIGGTPTATAANAATVINAHEEGPEVIASSTGAVLTLTAIAPGVGGNSITVAETSSGFAFAASATSLAGGSDETENRAIGIAAQPVLSGQMFPFYIGGVFNHEAIVWPAAIDTLYKRQRVFDRTNLTIGKILGVNTSMTIP